MTNERDPAEPGAATDAEVSAAYRELAEERAPDRLNRRVLAEAASAVERRYLRPAPWMRPVAWAATLALSLAIILQVMRLPPPEAAFPETPFPDPRAREEATPGTAHREGEADEFRPRDLDTLRQAEEFAVMQDGDTGGTAAATGAATRRPDSHACDDETRRSPSTWYECIRELRRTGRDEVARLELSQLRDAYPDFEPDG